MLVWHLWSVLNWDQFLYYIFYHHFLILHAGKPFCVVLRIDPHVSLPWGLIHADPLSIIVKYQSCLTCV